MTSSRLLLIWKTLGHKLKALDAMNSSGLRVEMNDSGSWAKGSRSYEKVRAMDDINNSKSWAQAFRDYE